MSNAQLFSKRRCEFIAWRNFYLMLNAGVVGKDNVSTRPVAKQANHGRMRAIENAHDPAFRSLASRTGRNTAETDQDMVAVHGIAHGVARNKNVAVQLGHPLLRNHNAVTVLMQNQPTGKRITPMRGGGRSL